MDLWDREAIDLVEPGFMEFGSLEGHLYFHLGDDSGFHAVPMGQESKVASAARQGR
jgi:hypothetical protein